MGGNLVGANRNWISDGPCGCGTENLVSRMVALVTSGIHHEVQVTFKCSKCSKTSVCTYQMTCKQRGKVAKWGTREGTDVERSMHREHPYHRVQRDYEAMWDREWFSFLTRNHQHWAAEFYNKLA